MRIVVIGSEGYIGSVVYSRLFPVHQVTGIDLGKFGQNGKSSQCSMQELTETYLSQQDLVVHLGGYSSVALCENNADSWIGNVADFEALLNKIGPNTRLLYASSASVYGKRDELCTEDMPFGETFSNYDRQKQQQDLLASHYISRGKNIFGLRFATVCGPSHNMRLDTLYNSLCYDALYNEKLNVSKNNYKRSILTTQDLSFKIKRFTEVRDIAPGMYNLSSFQTTVHDAVSDVQRAFRVKFYRSNDLEIEYNEGTSNYDFHLSTQKYQNAYNVSGEQGVHPGFYLATDILNHLRNDRIRFQDKSRFIRK